MHNETCLAKNTKVIELEAAEGYLQLGMAEDAFVELRNLPLSKQSSERFKELLLATHMMLEQWPPASKIAQELCLICLLYTSPSPRDLSTSRMPSSA